MKTKKKNLSINNNGRGVNHLLDVAYKILGNPIMMFDTSYKLLAHTENKVKDDFLWNEFVKTGTFSHETVNFFSSENFIDDVANAEVSTMLKSDKLKYERINAKIFDKDNIHIANICILACYRPFEEKDFKDIEKICEDLSVEIQNSKYYQNIERVFEETFITKLIEGKEYNKVYIADKIKHVYENLKNNIYLAVIDITKYEYSLTHLAYFRDLFKTLQSEFKYFIYLNNIVAIISTDNQILDIKSDLFKLNEFFSQNNIFAGISDSFQNIFDMQKYYKQALNALNYGMNIDDDPTTCIFEYNNFKLDYFLDTVKNEINIEEMCHPVIFLIQDHDKKHNTSYFNILLNYLLFGMNSTLTAKKLKTKHQDLCQQLFEIEKEFSIDWNNGNMIFSIFNSIKIIKKFL